MTESFFADEHSLRTPASAMALDQAVRTTFSARLRGPGVLYAWLVDIDKDQAFTISEHQPGRLIRAVGAHRFASFAMIATIADSDRTERLLTLRTEATFKGRLGRVYRALVIGTGGHLVATRFALRLIARRALALDSSGALTKPGTPGQATGG